MTQYHSKMCIEILNMKATDIQIKKGAAIIQNLHHTPLEKIIGQKRPRKCLRNNFEIFRFTTRGDNSQEKLAK